MIQSVDRALNILCQFDRQVQELGVTELSALLGLSKSTVHGLVKTLEMRGFLARNPENGKYRLGLKLFELGVAYAAAIELQQAARPAAQKLSAQYDEAVHIAIYAGGMAVFIMRIEPRLQVLAFPRVGASLPAHATALGKVLLAHLPAEESQEYLEENLYALTRYTITSPELMLKEMAAICDRGYGVDQEEAMGGISCVAAPIKDHTAEVIAAISLSGPVEKILGEKHTEIIRDVIIAARQISLTLGFSD